MTAALILIALAALALGVVARAGRDMDLEQWAVGGRGFGWIFVFLLLAGEIYTTFTFLGASGFSYGQGAPVYYILAYGSLAYVIAYFLLPLVWSYARENGLHSQPDFFVRKYASPMLGVLVSIVDLVALIPYLVLQLTGLGIIVTAAGYGAIPRDAAIWIGAAIVTVYVMTSGIRGSAYTSVVKDILILGVALFLGLYLPSHLYGGIGPMFEQIAAAKPGCLVFPASGQSVAWFVSTVLLTAIGFFMWPHSFSACYSAKDARVFRRNAIVLPIYQLILLFVFFVGFAAVLQRRSDRSPRQVARAGRDAGRRLLYLDRQRDDRGDASGGLQLRHPALSCRHREPDAAQSGDSGWRLRRNSGWSGRRRRPQLHSCDHRLAVSRPAGSDPRPQRRHHRACRKYRRVDRRQRSEQDAHSFGRRHLKVGQEIRRSRSVLMNGGRR